MADVELASDDLLSNSDVSDFLDSQNSGRQRNISIQKMDQEKSKAMSN